jgi:hypothetical protein
MKEISIQLNVVNPFSIQFQTMGMMVIHSPIQEKTIPINYFLGGTTYIITCTRTIYSND